MTCSSLILDPIVKWLAGKVALITGAASGIGETTARLYARYGAKVVIADIQDELGAAVRDSINNLSKSDAVDFVHCDVTRESDVQNAVDFAVGRHGKLDIMFNNAGATGNLTSTILDVSREDFNKVLDVNFYGSFLGAKRAARVMIPARKGSILFSSSCASVVHGDAPHAYTASKHALVGLTKNLYVELGQYGIRVNCISRFGVVTPMLCKAMGMEKEAVEEVVSATANLKGSAVTAEDVAETAVFLGSDESKYVSWMNMVIDGGYSVTNPVLRGNIGLVLPLTCSFGFSFFGLKTK